MSVDRAILLRIGQPEHIHSLRNHGELHFTPLRSYALLRGDKQRSDPLEGADRIVQPNDIDELVIECDQERHVIRTCDLVGPISLGLGARPSIGAFCMVGVREPLPDPIVDPRNLDFGAAAIIILDTQRFLQRVAAACMNEGLRHDMGFVDYFDPNSFSGETGPFMKPERFRHQSEFRIVIALPSCDAYSLRLGDMSSITTRVVPSASLSSLSINLPE